MKQRSGILYKALSLWIRIGLRAYFSKISIKGFHHIPKTGAVMLVANHQNALLDALVVAVHIERPIYFITRADVFNRPLIARFLASINMLPIYRQRDNVDTIALNKPIFEKTAEILHQQGAILIFPEGNQARVRNLRPLQKGFARMGFGAAALSEFENDIQLVPIGINYSHHTEARGTLFVQAGQPISFKDFYPIYIENQQKGLKDISTQISPLIQFLIIHIPNSDHHQTIDFLRTFYLPVQMQRHKLTHVLASQHEQEQKIADALENHRQVSPNEFHLLSEKVDLFHTLNQKVNISPEIFSKPPLTLLSFCALGLMLLLLMPIALFGMFNHLLAILLVKYIVRNKVKDQNFLASIKFLGSMVVFTLFYIIQSILVGLLSGNWWIALLYLILLPVSGGVYLFWQNQVKNLLQQWTYRQFLSDPKNELMVLYREIMDRMDKMVMNGEW